MDHVTSIFTDPRLPTDDCGILGWKDGGFLEVECELRLPGSGPKVAMELEDGHVIFESGRSLPKGSTYNLRHQFQGHLVRALEERSLRE